MLVLLLGRDQVGDRRLELGGRRPLGQSDTDEGRELVDRSVNGVEERRTGDESTFGGLDQVVDAPHDAHDVDVEQRPPGGK